MRFQARLFLIATLAVLASPESKSQRTSFLASPTQVVAIRAGRLLDAKTGNLLSDQIVLIHGDRIVDVGPAVQIPPAARVIDLSTSTVLPGMIDTHVHVNTGGETPAERAYIALANTRVKMVEVSGWRYDVDTRGK